MYHTHIHCMHVHSRCNQSEHNVDVASFAGCMKDSPTSELKEN